MASARADKAGWLSRIDINPNEFLHSDQLNFLGLDIRNWGGDVNGGAHHLTNVILEGSGGFQFHPSPLEITPGADGQTVTQFDQTVAGNQVARWTAGKDATAETGGNAGSNFAIKRYDDAGAFLGTPFSINRATGLITMGSQFWTGPVNANGQTLSNVVIPGMLSDPTLAKGDMLARSTSALIRVGVGGDGQVLTADAASTAGVKWATPASQVFSVFGRIGNVVATAGDYTAAQVTNAVASNQFYSDPSWISSLAYSKLTGVPALVPATRQVLAGAGMGGGGALSADVTLTANVRTVFGRTGDVVLTGADLAGAGVVPDTRRIIAGTGLGGGGALSADVTLTANVTSVFGRIGAVVLTTADLTAAGGALASRTITTGTGLSGGGDLSVDRTFTVIDDSTIQKTRVSKAGALQGTRREINFVNGANVAIAVVDNAANNRLDVTVTSNAGSGGMPDPTAVLGDLIVRGPTSPERLPVGSNALVLTADNTQPLGIKWASPAAVALTPWTSDIDAANHKLTNVNRIGIGLTTPGYPLDIVGDVNISGTYRVAGAPLLTALTPWTSDIDAANFKLKNAGRIGVGNDATVLPDSGTTDIRLIVGSATLTTTFSTQISIIGNRSDIPALIGTFNFANYNITAADKRIAAINANADPTKDSGTLIFYTWNAGVVGERMRITAAGNVGVGNTGTPLDPDAAVTHLIVGSTALGSTAGEITVCKNVTTTNTSCGAFAFGNANRVTADKRVALILGGTESTLDSGYMAFATWNAGVFGERMRITATGRVGIGTTTPGAPLDLNKTADGGYHLAFSMAGVQQYGVYAHSTGYLQFDSITAGKNVLQLSAAGNVGIGSSPGPGERLSVLSNDNALATNILAVRSQNGVQGIGLGYSAIRQLGVNAPLSIDSNGAGVLSLQANGGTGNVGIGTTTPGALLGMQGGNLGTSAGSIISMATLQFSDPNNDQLKVHGYRNVAGSDWNTVEWRIQHQVDASAMGWLGFPAQDCTIGTGATERMRITSGGNVGIGTTNPQVLLHCYRATQGGNTAIAIDNDAINPPIGQVLQFRYGSSGVLGGIYHITDAAGAPWFLRFKLWTQAAEQERMCINGSSGNVGIGTTNPLNVLHVRGGTNHNIGLRSYTGRASIGAFSDAGAVGPLGFDANQFDFSGGKVGIGTTNIPDWLTVGGDNIRLAQSPYGVVFRNDGNSFYLLVTNSGDPYGTWKSPFPIAINLTTCGVSLGAGLTVTGNCNITGQYQVNGVPIGSGGGVTIQNVVTGSRAVNTVYQNTTGKPMFVDVISPLGQNGTMSAYTDSTSNPTTRVAAVANGSTVQTNLTVSFWVLPGNYYNVNSTGSNGGWTEWY
jgi:hypothetical protein